ncbi:LysR family transcriptional regulator, partial [Burkholderia gladioli]|uniref:LysR family transcriptional regulator n=1 Tax=Burkholderia gladioli TaxID=28095 RepID=UPI003F79B67A
MHFGRAAERLHVGQSSVSESIRALEKTVGAPLFDRTSRRVALTPLGQALREGAEAAPTCRSRPPSPIAGARRLARRASCASASWAAAALSSSVLEA